MNRIVILMTLMLVIIMGCKTAPVDTIGVDINDVDIKNGEIPQISEYDKKIAASSDKFGIKLFKKINESNQNENLLISPLSISFVLGMVLNGANNATYDSIKSVLELQNYSQENVNRAYKNLIDVTMHIDTKVKFKIANAIFYRNSLSFEQNFIDLNKEYFYANVQGLDFDNKSSVNIINQWVSEKTEKKINHILDDIKQNEVMFLINALYFKGDWKMKFDSNNTKNDWFNDIKGNRISCKMMHDTLSAGYFETDEFQAIDLPYGNGNFSMVIFLPKSGININTIIQNLNTEKWNDWMQKFKIKTVNLFLPKFKFKKNENLNNILKSLGMQNAFNPSEADFTKMYRGPYPLHISNVAQSTYIDVNEEGTEAVAVTLGGFGIVSLPPPPVPMRCDRPFIFAIVEKNLNCIIFIGKLATIQLNIN